MCQCYVQNNSKRVPKHNILPFCHFLLSCIWHLHTVPVDQVIHNVYPGIVTCTVDIFKSRAIQEEFTRSNYAATRQYYTPLSFLSVILVTE